MYRGPEGEAMKSYGLSDTIQRVLEPRNDPPLWETTLQDREGILLFHLCCTITVVVFIYWCNEQRHRIMCRFSGLNLTTEKKVPSWLNCLESEAALLFNNYILCVWCGPGGTCTYFGIFVEKHTHSHIHQSLRLRRTGNSVAEERNTLSVCERITNKCC